MSVLVEFKYTIYHQNISNYDRTLSDLKWKTLDLLDFNESNYNHFEDR